MGHGAVDFCVRSEVRLAGSQAACVGMLEDGGSLRLEAEGRED